MANEKNLRPQTERTKSEQREIAKKGGIASGESRRQKRTLRKSLELALQTKNPDGITRQDEIVIALIDKAVKGDIRAFEVIRDSIGEKPSDKVDLFSSDGSMTPKSWTPKDVADELIAQMQEMDNDE